MRKSLVAVSSPLPRVVCGTCLMSQVLRTGQTMCQNSGSPHGPHRFVMFVPPPLKGIPLFQAKDQVLPPRENSGPVDDSPLRVEDPVDIARTFLFSS